MIPVTVPETGRLEIQAVEKVLRSGWLTQGPKTTEFEESITRYTGAKYGVAASSGTTALMLALAAADVGPGDEVITSPYSFIATANAIVAIGAVPVFSDIDLASYNLAPGEAAKKISSRTKALMPVDQMGLPCELQSFQNLADSNQVNLVIDAACSLGSLCYGRPIGAQLKRRHTACFSFHPRKVITTGEGGMLVCSDKEIAHKARSLATHGAGVFHSDGNPTNRFIPPEYPRIGYNFRMSDILSAVGIAQMERLPGILVRRKALAARYDEAFAGFDRIIVPVRPSWAAANYQTYQIRIDGADRQQRDAVVDRLRSKGVMATFGVADIHRQEAYRKRFGEQSFPNAELAADTTIILPLFPQMTDQDQQRCVEALVDIL